MLLERTLVKRVEFVNENVIKEKIEIDANLERKFQCTNNDENGILELILVLKDKNDDGSDAFRLAVKMDSIFSLKDEKNIHDRTDELRDKAANFAYSHLVAYVSTFMPLAGLPALFLPTTLQAFDNEDE